MKNIGEIIQRIIDGENLYYNEAYNTFEAIFKGEVEEFEMGAFLAALSTKGETSDEILGCYKAIYKYDTNIINLNMEIVDNSGTGRDHIKTFNVSTASAIIAAAGGINIAKHGARAITSRCGSIDILESIGIDVDLSVEDAAEVLKKIGITVFNGMSPKVHTGILYKILTKIHFGSIFNISASLASPVKPTYGVRGVFKKDIIGKTAAVMKKIGYKKGIVYCGMDKSQNIMDEISPVGETFIMEFDETSFSDMYLIDPDYFGIGDIDIKDILALKSIEEERERFLSVIKGDNYSGCIEFASINAAPIFYITGRAKDLREGYTIAKELVLSGKAWNKYLEWRNISK